MGRVSGRVADLDFDLRGRAGEGALPVALPLRKHSCVQGFYIKGELS